MTIDDLQQECKKCDGEGKLVNGRTQKESMAKTGRIGQQVRQNCPVCGGKGLVPTQAGEAILQFLRTHRS